MNLNHYTTNDYENKSGLLTPAKQTQSNPTCSELVEPISKGEGGGVFEQFSCEVEELSGISAVCDFVVNRESHIH